MDCPFCGTPNNEGKFCTNCGTPLPEETIQRSPDSAPQNPTACAGEAPEQVPFAQAFPTESIGAQEPAQSVFQPQPADTSASQPQQPDVSSPEAPINAPDFPPAQPGAPVEPNTYPHTYSGGAQPPRPPVPPAGMGAANGSMRPPIPQKPKKGLGLIITCILLGVACALSFAFAIVGNFNALQVREKLTEAQAECASLASENEALSQELDAMESQNSVAYSKNQDTYKIAQAGDSLFIYPAQWLSYDTDSSTIYNIGDDKTMNTVVQDLTDYADYSLEFAAPFIIQGIEKNNAKVKSYEKETIGDLDTIHVYFTMNVDSGAFVDAQAYLFSQGDYMILLTFGQVNQIESGFEEQIRTILKSVTQKA